MRKCYYHPQLMLHNFCVNKECALPLCPKCINPHLQQSRHNHRILLLSDIQQMIVEQVGTSICALKYQLQQLKENFNPQEFLKQYEQLLAKYKKQEIDQVIKHFQEIQQQLREQITNKYNNYILPFIQPIEMQLKDLQFHQKQIEQGKHLESIIKIVHQDTISLVQNLLSSIQAPKIRISDELPSLSYRGNGLIEVIPVPPHHHVNQPLKEQIFYRNTVENQNNWVKNDLYDVNNRMDKISQLENRLITIRRSK